MRITAGLVAAFAAAVAVETLATCAYTTLQVLASGHGLGAAHGGGLAFVALGAAYVSARIALVTVVLIALPYVIISHKLQHVSLIYDVLSGTVIGAGVFMVMILRRFTYPAPPLRMGSDQYFLAISAIVVGAVAALTFWVVARPDKDAKPVQRGT